LFVCKNAESTCVVGCIHYDLSIVDRYTLCALGWKYTAGIPMTKSGPDSEGGVEGGGGNVVHDAGDEE
jgi:hypothetical protein